MTARHHATHQPADALPDVDVLEPVESRWQPYPEYKDSGVEWLGEIPLHWKRTSLKWLLISLKDGTHGTFARVVEGVPLLSAKNVIDGNLLVTDNESLISYEDFEEINRNGYLKHGDLLLTIVGTIGRAAIFDWSEPVAFQRSVAVLRFHPEHSVRYYFYLSQASYFQKYLTVNSKQSAQGGIYLSDLAIIPTPVPPLSEQRAIAAFLDRETAKIDALIAKKQRLIDLLREQRSALISHAVTKGLDPSVPMRDSGITWLGEIPAHWESTRVKMLSQVKRGASPRPIDDPIYFDENGEYASIPSSIRMN